MKNHLLYVGGFAALICLIAVLAVRQVSICRHELEQIRQLEKVVAHVTTEPAPWPYSWCGCQRASWVAVKGSAIDEASLAQALQRVPIATLSAAETNLGDSTLSSLHAAEIRSLILTRTRVTDTGCKTIQHFRNLHDLLLGETAITSAGVRDLSTLPQLELLDLSGTAIDDSALATIRTLATLRGLVVDRTNVNDRGIAMLGGHGELKVLSLSDTGVTDRGCEAIAKIPTLTDVSLANTPVGDNGVKALRGLALERLDLDGTGVTDDIVDELLSWATLERLSIRATRISQERTQQLQKAMRTTMVLSD